jgi:hypothetical protein
MMAEAVGKFLIIRIEPLLEVLFPHHRQNVDNLSTLSNYRMGT